MSDDETPPADAQPACVGDDETDRASWQHIGYVTGDGLRHVSAGDVEIDGVPIVPFGHEEPIRIIATNPGTPCVPVYDHDRAEWRLGHYGPDGQLVDDGPLPDHVGVDSAGHTKAIPPIGTLPKMTFTAVTLDNPNLRACLGLGSIPRRDPSGIVLAAVLLGVAVGLVVLGVFTSPWWWAGAAALAIIGAGGLSSSIPRLPRDERGRPLRSKP